MYLRNVHWTNFVNLTKAEVEQISTEDKGVYIIWSFETKPQIIYVGSGNIKECLIRHISGEGDPVAQAHIPNLRTVYANIKDENKTPEENELDQRGVENYLAYIYRPKYGNDFPNETPREIDLPFELIDNIYPIELGLNYTKALLDWDAYKQDFRNWAEKQHGEDFAEPQKEDNH